MVQSLEGLPFGAYKVNDIEQKLFGSGASTFAVDCDKVDGMTMVAIWWVATALDKGQASMALAHVIVSGGVQVPVLKNTRVIKPFSRLLKCQAVVVAKTTSLQLRPQAKPDTQGELANKQGQNS